MIRSATPADADAIVNIYNHYIDHTIITFEETPIQAEEMGRRIADTMADYPYLVFEENAVILGYAYATRWRPRSAYRYAVETSIYLHKDHGGKGIGTQLYGALIKELRLRPLRTALGGIALPNAASVALHEKMGFQKTAELADVGFKFNRWINVGYWQLML